MITRVLFPNSRASTILAAAAAMLLLSGAFIAPAWAITGGKPDDGKHPNVCTVIVYHPVFGLLPCSGMLIHPRVVLTAGHIVNGVQSGYATLYGVSFGDRVDVTNPTLLDVSDLVCRFTRRGADPDGSDIGLLILQEPVTSLTPQPLPAAGYLDRLRKDGQLEAGPNGTKFTVVGYGCGLDWSPPEPIPPISDEGIVIRNAAQSGYLGLNGGWLFLNQNLAAGYGGTALGDSGGPAFCTDPEIGDEVLVAITSWGDPDGVAHGIYSRIDTAEVLAFIHDVIDSLEAELP